MALLVDQITVGELKIAVLDSAPNTGAGYVAEVGSLAMVEGSPILYKKENSGDTDWDDIPTSASLSGLYIPASEKGAASGVAPLNGSSKIDATYLPSYVDDVEEYANLAAFPVSGETGKIYVALDTDKIYRWSGSMYIEISPSEVNSVFGRSGAVTAQNGDYTASQVTNVPAGGIAAVTVQAAIDELDSEKFNSADFSSSFDSEFATKSTTDLAEGSNLYFTDEKAQDAVGTILVDSATVDFTYDDGVPSISASVIQSGIDHGSISGLLDDDHTQYALLDGRSGGQELIGGIDASDDLSLSSTSDATKGKILLGDSSAFDEENDRLAIGSVSPDSVLDLTEAGVRFNIRNTVVSTVGNVTGDVATVTTASNSVELIKVFVTGFNAANTQSVAYERTVRVRNNAGTVNLGTIQSDYTDEGTGLTAANITFVVSGADVIVRVTGVSAITLSWKCVMNRMR
jgi:hypothetical protein